MSRFASETTWIAQLAPGVPVSNALIEHITVLAAEVGYLKSTDASPARDWSLPDIAPPFVYFDADGNRYYPTGEFRQVSHGEYYLDSDRVKIWTGMACPTGKPYPILKRAAAIVAKGSKVLGR